MHLDPKKERDRDLAAELEIDIDALPYDHADPIAYLEPTPYERWLEYLDILDHGEEP